jgi:hypothetical protein
MLVKVPYGWNKRGIRMARRFLLSHAVVPAVNVAKCRARVAWVRPGSVVTGDAPAETATSRRAADLRGCPVFPFEFEGEASHSILPSGSAGTERLRRAYRLLLRFAKDLGDPLPVIRQADWDRPFRGVVGRRQDSQGLGVMGLPPAAGRLAITPAAPSRVRIVGLRGVASASSACSDLLRSTRGCAFSRC